MVVDLFLVYQFVRRLATPFENWDAYKLGIIDKDGKVLKPRKTLKTKKEEQAWGLYDIMLANIKKLLAKVPGGSSRLASYAAALFLIKEYKHFTDDSLITEDMDESELDNILLEFQNRYGYYNTLAENVNSNLVIEKLKATDDMGDWIDDFQKSDAPQFKGKSKEKRRQMAIAAKYGAEREAGMREDVSAGGGAIAGLGIGPDGEPGVPPKARKKYKDKNKSKLLSFKERMK